MISAGSASPRESEHPMISKCGVYFSRAEAKPFIEGSTNERQMQLMTVDGVTYKTIVYCCFTRCFYHQPRPSLKPRQSTGNGPSIDVRVMVAKVKNPDLNDDDHWRDLNVNCSVLDDGTQLTLFKFFFDGFGSQQCQLDTDEHAERILRGLVRYFSVLYDCPGFPMPSTLSWTLTTKAGSVEKRNESLLLEYARNASIKPHVKRAFQLRSPDGWYARLE